MHRAPFIHLLESYLVRFPAERDAVGLFMDFVQAHPDCFERSLSVGHITASAWLVTAAGTDVLLTHHRKLNRWLQLGGHVDGNPDVLDSALREAREESGLSGIKPVSREIFDLDRHLIPARGNEPAHFHYDVRFLLRTTGAEEFTVSDESHDLRWVPLGELPAFTSEPSMLRMAGKFSAAAPGV